MRRSKAPSVLNKATRLPKENNCTDPEEEYDWGSRKSKSKKNNKINRTFNVVWRDVSSKKRKIWKGDGSLEVDVLNLKAILKDESGKYIGCSTKVNVNDLVPDFQMIISGKEVEIQSEIEDSEELQNLRKTQIENMANDDWKFANDNSEEAKKPKGGFKFKPVLVLKSPTLIASERVTEMEELSFKERTTNTYNECKFSVENSNNTKVVLDSPLSPKNFNEFICFLKPSELQQFLFQKVLDYVSFSKSDMISSFDVELTLKVICNHPSLLNHKTTTNELCRHLIQFLPDWTEMGPFDSCKLEFVQYLLTDIAKSIPQLCIILAKTANVLNMLQGLCDFMKIKCLRLNSNDTQNLESREDGSTFVILTSSLETLSCAKLPTLCKKVIVFEEYTEFSNISSVKNLKNWTTYYLVTAFSIEELTLLHTYESFGRLLHDLANTMNKEYDGCYLHARIGCNCFENNDNSSNMENVFIRSWNHFKTPFDLQFLEVCTYFI